MKSIKREQFANQKALMTFMKYNRIEEKLNYESIVTTVTLIKNEHKKTYRNTTVHLSTVESYNSWGEVTIEWDVHYVGYKCDGIYSLEFDFTSDNELSIKSPEGWEVIIQPLF